MSVSGWSVQHDPEVQEYNQRRAAWKSSEKERKQEERFLREQAKAIDKQFSLQQAVDLGPGIFPNIFRRHTESGVRKWGWSLKWKSRSRKRQLGKTAFEGKVDCGYDSDEMTLTEAWSARK